MNTKTKTTMLLALGAGLSIFSFLHFGNPTLTALNGTAVEMDTTAVEDYYGYDRLSDEALADEQWLPEISVAGTADFARAGHVLDTISLNEWAFYANSLRLKSNPGGLLPLDPAHDIQLLRPKTAAFAVFSSSLRQQVDFREAAFEDRLPMLAENCSREEPALLLLDQESANALGAQTTQLLDLAADMPLAIVYFGTALPDFLREIALPVLHLADDSATAQAIAVQALFGALDIPLARGGQLAAVRLGHAPPELVGIDRTKLERIDRYVNSAIRRRAIPGCQVLVAKAGKIVYEKTFGYHTYAKEQPVDPMDVYDLASITKAAATTLGLMQLHDKEKLPLASRVRDYLPGYDRSGIRYLRMRHLLSHHTGLQGNLPIASFLRQDDIFSDTKNENYLTALGKNMFLRNEVRESLLEQLKYVKTPRRSFYRYSDVNFILLQQVLEQQTGQSMDAYLGQNFYEPLGLRRLQFLPGLALPDQEIVPTEKDRKWRNHLVHGEVHDESALLMGGVAGHAGLFSNARDLAAIFQMLLNGGSYGENTFFSPETVETFTSRNGYNYRAFGFDRLAGHSKSLRHYGASKDTYGHTGFTGTCVWADPDNDLVFIFLSNRIHPDKSNNKLQKLGLRERLHKIVYQSLGTAQEEA